MSKILIICEGKKEKEILEQYSNVIKEKMTFVIFNPKHERLYGDSNLLDRINQLK